MVAPFQGFRTPRNAMHSARSGARPGPEPAHAVACPGRGEMAAHSRLMEGSGGGSMGRGPSEGPGHAPDGTAARAIFGRPQALRPPRGALVSRKGVGLLSALLRGTPGLRDVPAAGPPAAEPPRKPCWKFAKS